MVWLMIELLFLFFLIFILTIDVKSVGLIIYFFFQSVISLLLFIVLLFRLDKIIFLLLVSKLGLFPFFYWMVIVSIKVGLWGNLFVLSLQKISVFWLLWLVFNVTLRFLYFLVYLSVFFVVFNLVLLRDLWLLLVYSSIANTGILIFSVYGNKYIFSVLLYLMVIFRIVFIIIKLDNYIELLLLVFFFMVIPPFVLFFIKFYIVVSLDFSVKLVFFLVIFDVFVLLYYFSLVFIKFILMDLGIIIYFINFFLVSLILFFRNYDTLIVFY